MVPVLKYLCYSEGHIGWLEFYNGRPGFGNGCLLWKKTWRIQLFRACAQKIICTLRHKRLLCLSCSTDWAYLLELIALWDESTRTSAVRALRPRFNQNIIRHFRWLLLRVCSIIPITSNESIKISPQLPKPSQPMFIPPVLRRNETSFN